jgi:3-oxoacyl-[acyl-carrier protein] reductase
MTATQPSERVVLITGANGGLGQALVSEFLGQGWSVAAGARQPALNQKPGILPVALDVTNRSQVKDAVDQVMKQWKRIDVLINNAGVIADHPLPEMEDSEWEKVLAVNLKGAFICSQMVLRPMLHQTDGQIVNISSFSARAPRRGQANYAAAKAGLFGLTQSLAQEVGSRNIRVNAVLPGVLQTGMTTHLKPEQLEAFANSNALKRINSVEEVACFIAFLATTRNISGQIFQLDSRISPWT